MKKFLKIRYILLPFLIGFILYNQAPVFYQNYKDKGEVLTPIEVRSLKDEKTELLPKEEGSLIVIFWVSWCRPCHLEMARFQRAIDSEKLNPGKIYAVNPFESALEIEKFLRENSYDFQFVQDFGALASQINIQGTPTIIHIKDRAIRYIHTGVSPLSLWRARSFLN